MINSLKTKPNIIAIGILALLILARLALALLVDLHPQIAYKNSDTFDYVNMAESLALGKAYSLDSQEPLDLLRAPGYPLFLAAVFKVAGASPGNVTLAQMLVSTLTGYLLYRLIRLRFSQRTALLAFGLYLVDPTTILWGLPMLSETLFTFAVILAIYLAALWLRRGKYYFLAMSGLAIGAGTLVRPIGQAYIAPLALLVLLRGAGSLQLKAMLKKNAPAVVYLIAGYLLLTAPWALRNKYVWDCPVVTTGPTINLRDWMVAKVVAEVDEIPLNQAINDLQATSDPICPTVNMEYIRILSQHPRVFLKLYAGGTIATLFSTSFDTGLQLFGVPYQLPDLWQPYLDGGLAAVFKILINELPSRPLVPAGFIGLLIFQLSLYLLAAWGLVQGWRHIDADWRWWLLLISATIILFLALPGPVGQDRFRVPIQPLLVYLAVIPFEAKKPSQISPGKISASVKGDFL